ncbi:hypothetical protein ABTN77_19255, partial [Acinetobacter baumannii]
SQIVEGKVSHYEIAAECGVFWTHNAFRGARRVPLFAQNAGSRNHLVALVRPQHMTALHHLVAQNLIEIGVCRELPSVAVIRVLFERL